MGPKQLFKYMASIINGDHIKLDNVIRRRINFENGMVRLEDVQAKPATMGRDTGAFDAILKIIISSIIQRFPGLIYYSSGNYIDAFSVCSDGEYLYIAGTAELSNYSTDTGIIVKMDKNLNIVKAKIYSGVGMDFYGITTDGTYLYVVGDTTVNSNSAFIAKFDKDLNVLAAKSYGGKYYDGFEAVYADGDYVYAVGQTWSEGSGYDDGLIVKFDKDLNIVARKVYGGSNGETLFWVGGDGTYIYAVGTTASEGSGDTDALIIKFDKDLNIVGRKVYGSNEREVFYSAYIDDEYVYAVGTTGSEQSNNYYALVVKFDKNLNVVTAKKYGGSGDDGFRGVYSDGTYLYAVGFTYSNASGEDFLIAKFDKNLNVIAAKTYIGNDDDEFEEVWTDGEHVYVVGFTYSEGSTDGSAIVVKWPASLSVKSVSPTTLVLQDANLTLQDINYTLQDSNLTLQDSNLSINDLNLTAGDITLSILNLTFEGE